MISEVAGGTMLPLLEELSLSGCGRLVIDKAGQNIKRMEVHVSLGLGLAQCAMSMHSWRLFIYVARIF